MCAAGHRRPMWGWHWAAVPSVLLSGPLPLHWGLFLGWQECPVKKKPEQEKQTEGAVQAVMAKMQALRLFRLALHGMVHCPHLGEGRGENEGLLTWALEGSTLFKFLSS